MLLKGTPGDGLSDDIATHKTMGCTHLSYPQSHFLFLFTVDAKFCLRASLFIMTLTIQQEFIMSWFRNDQSTPYPLEYVQLQWVTKRLLVRQRSLIYPNMSHEFISIYFQEKSFLNVATLATATSGHAVLMHWARDVLILRGMCVNKK